MVTVPAIHENVPGPMDLVRLVTRFNLHPEAELHPSWLPADWPTRHRTPARLGPRGRAVLSQLLMRASADGVSNDFNFDSRGKRLVLLDAGSLRCLALYCGLCAHLPLLRQRGALSGQIRRQARRLGDDALDFVLERVPELTEIRMDAKVLKDKPAGAGHVIATRGYRLLLGLMATEGEAVLQRLQHKMPRRVSTYRVPALEARQQRQLGELVLSCIVPERLPQWDWLF